MQSKTMRLKAVSLYRRSLVITEMIQRAYLVKADWRL